MLAEAQKVAIKVLSPFYVLQEINVTKFICMWKQKFIFDLQVTREHQIQSPMVSKYEWRMCIKSPGPWTRYINDPYGLSINDPYAPNLNNLHEPNVNTNFYQIWMTRLY